MYTWLKFGHLVGLVLLSGGMATQLIAYAGLLRAGTVGELRTWQKLPEERLTDGGMGLARPPAPAPCPTYVRRGRLGDRDVMGLAYARTVAPRPATRAITSPAS